MGQLNGTRIYEALQNFFSCLDDVDKELVANVYCRDRLPVSVTDGGTAGTAQTATPFFTNDMGTPLLVKSVQIMTPVSVTGNDATNAVITVDRVDATGANAVTIATLTTNVASGGTTAFVPKAIPLSTVAGAISIPAGFTLRVSVAKTSTGVAIAAATSQAYVQVQIQPSQF